MALAFLPLDIDQGEDWTAQVVITDQDGNAVSLARPMQMDLRNAVGSVVLSLQTLTETEEATSLSNLEIPEITFSPDVGMIQIHIDKSATAGLAQGVYQYDLFASVNDGSVYSGTQRMRVLAGQAIVNQRVTVM